MSKGMSVTVAPLEIITIGALLQWYWEILFSQEAALIIATPSWFVKAVVLSQSDAFKMNPEPCLDSFTSCLQHLLILAYAARQTRTTSSRGLFLGHDAYSGYRLRPEFFLWCRGFVLLLSVNFKGVLQWPCC